MKAWLHAQDQAKPLVFGYRQVFNRTEAAEMTENNAHEVMRGAEDSYPEYRWEMVKVSGNLFIVEGTQK
jgi:hypothetical protein